MSNMSYCRFQNTLADLQDCYDNWDIGSEADMSPLEKKAKTDLLALCKEIAIDIGGLEDDE